ncbi:hypothetical protein [Streptomyces melanogenes]
MGSAAVAALDDTRYAAVMDRAAGPQTDAAFSDVLAAWRAAGIAC